jgi:hypothetical protein
MQLIGDNTYTALDELSHRPSLSMPDTAIEVLDGGEIQIDRCRGIIWILHYGGDPERPSLPIDYDVHRGRESAEASA